MTVGRRVAISILSQPVTALKSFDLGLSLCLPIEIESEAKLKSIDSQQYSNLPPGCPAQEQRPSHQRQQWPKN